MIDKIKNILWIVLVFSIVFTGPVSCQREEEKTSINRIVLVTFDTLRADHLSCYGYPRPTSPFIDSLAAGGGNFLNTYAPMPSTVPSHASIFTSLYPVQMNLLKNGHRLDDSVITMAEFLKKAGYDTAAFVSTTRHFTQGNLLQGFEYVDRPDIPNEVLYLPADKIVDKVISWLKGIKTDDRFFLWVHFYDAHSPYMPPPEILDKFSGISEDERNKFTRFLQGERHVDPEFFSIIPEDYLRDSIDLSRYGDKKVDGVETMLRVINAYDGEVRFLDTEIERLFSFFERLGLANNTLWVITSDHGEGLGNHWWFEHEKYLYNEQIHVPLIFYCPGRIIPGKAEKQSAGLVDILPTIAELIGRPLGNKIKARQGVSLSSILSDSESSSDTQDVSSRYAISQRRYYQEPDTDDFISPGEGYEGEAFSIQDDRYKYILRSDAEDGFYDLKLDPYEADNQVGRRGQKERELKERLIARIKYLKSTTRGRPEVIGKDGIEKLKALGYVQ